MKQDKQDMPEEGWTVKEIPIQVQPVIAKDGQQYDMHQAMVEILKKLDELIAIAK